MGQEFFINGPIGKGYELTPENTNSSYMALVGGTGILPFMDLIAFIARKAIFSIQSDNALFGSENFQELDDGFSLTFYAYFPKRDQSIAVDFCSGVHQLCVMANKPHWF